jgi:hypothetical protein
MVHAPGDFVGPMSGTESAAETIRRECLSVCSDPSWPDRTRLSEPPNDEKPARVGKARMVVAANSGHSLISRECRT